MIRVRDWGGGGATAGFYTAAGRGRRAGPPSCWGRWGLGHAATVPLPLGRACPCCVVGQASGPCTTRAFGSCRHGHGGSRAVPPMGYLEIYTIDPNQSLISRKTEKGIHLQERRWIQRLTKLRGSGLGGISAPPCHPLRGSAQQRAPRGGTAKEPFFLIK
jgi:hypothetical protein